MTKSIVGEKAYSFSLKIIKVYERLGQRRLYRLADQILGSGTSIVANIEEGLGDTSQKEFLQRLGIAYREGCETRLWLRMLNDSGYIRQEEFIELNNDLEEILRLLGAIRKTVKLKIKGNSSQ